MEDSFPCGFIVNPFRIRLVLHAALPNGKRYRRGLRRLRGLKSKNSVLFVNPRNLRNANADATTKAAAAATSSPAAIPSGAQPEPLPLPHPVPGTCSRPPVGG